MELSERFQWISGQSSFSFGLNSTYELNFTYYFYETSQKVQRGIITGISTKLRWNLISADIFNDVVRVTPKIGYQINPNWKVAFFTGYNYTRDLAGAKFHSNNIIYRFRVYYNISAGKNK